MNRNTKEELHENQMGNYSIVCEIWHKDALRIEVSDFMNNWHERFT